MFLLVINFTSHTIGPSAWCPNGNCWINPFNGDANSFEVAQRFDEEDHNTLGALQLVAKALEVWFVFVATNLVYNVAMMLASMPDGIPIAYLMSHLECIDLKSLIDPLLWTAPISHGKDLKRRSRTLKLYLFTILAALMCVLANLMGPAVAVLILPSLQWKSTTKNAMQQFIGTNIQNAPEVGILLGPDCNTTVLSQRAYSCTFDPNGYTLDEVVDSAYLNIEAILAEWTANGIFDNNRNAENLNVTAVVVPAENVPAVLEESGVSLLLNFTNNQDGTQVMWAPSRQVLRDLSTDLEKLTNVTMGIPSDESYNVYNNSLQNILVRQGPVLGVSSNDYSGNVSITTFDDSAGFRQIRCYNDWTPAVNYSDISNITKCIRIGEGWNATNRNASFHIGQGNSSNIAASVNVFFSDKATYFNNSESPACLSAGVAPAGGICDWDTIFNPTTQPPPLKTSAVNVLTIEVGLPNSDIKMLYEFVTYLEFPNYSLDTSLSSNPTVSVQLDGLGDISQMPGSSLVVHPDWILAAWSADYDGTIPNTRASTSYLGSIAEFFQRYDASIEQGDNTWLAFNTVQSYAVVQALSIVNYNYTNLTGSPVPTEDDPSHPILSTWGLVHVWTFGINSRTSILGVVVVIAGIVCVVVRIMLGLITNIRVRSTTELVAAALEYKYKGEFDGMDDDERRIGKVRYQVVDDAAGKLEYIPVVSRA